MGIKWAYPLAVLPHFYFFYIKIGIFKSDAVITNQLHFIRETSDGAMCNHV